MPWHFKQNKNYPVPAWLPMRFLLKTKPFVHGVFLFFFSAPSPKGRDCPFLGRYEISGGLNAEDVGKALAAIKPGSENNQEKPTPCNPPGKQYLTVGCNSPDIMEFQSECGTKTVAGKRKIPNVTPGSLFIISLPSA